MERPIVSDLVQGDKRLPGETYDEYRERRKDEREGIDEYLNGFFIWRSKHIATRKGNTPGTSYTEEVMDDGTYIKKEHGLIGNDLEREVLNDIHG